MLCWIALQMPSALAQSSKALEAVRLHRSDARKIVDAELSACKKARCAAQKRLTLLAGYLALSDGEAAEARALLEKTTAPPQLEPFHDFYLGQAYFYSGRPKQSAARFEAALKNAPPSLRPRALARVGEAALKAGDYARANTALEEAAPLLDVPELYRQRARVRRTLGNVDGALADAKLLALRFPTHPDGIEAANQLAAAGDKGRFTFEERLRRAFAFLDAGDRERAWAELVAVDKDELARGDSAQARLALAKSQVAFSQGRKEEGEKLLDHALKGQDEVAAEAALMKARRAMREDDNALARKLMAEVLQKYPKQGPAQEAAFFVGWLDLRANRFKEAAEAFHRYVQLFPRTRRTDEALWFEALALLKAGDFAGARSAFDGIIQRYPRSSLVPQARYWMIRAAQLGGAKGEELAPRYQELAEAYPATFYGVLSSARLQELGRPATKGVLPRWKRPKKARVPPELGLAEALAKAGLFTDLGEELERVGRTARTPQKALAVGQALDAWGEHGPAYQIAARRLWGEAFTARNIEALSLLYPRAFRNAVEDAAKAEQVDPFFVWAIMRRESNFRPEVMSAADARGLMQIIPPTASAIAKQLGEPAPDPDSLFSPEVNIRYAAWYLSRLFQRFSHPVLVAGAYNAGPPRAVTWAGRPTLPELDLFVEEIPFKETRGYVKQVVADHFVYHALYGDPDKAPRLSLTVPTPRDGVEF